MTAKKGIIGIFLFLQLVSVGLTAQSSKIQQKYKYGKELLATEKYLQAIEVFKRISRPENGDEIYLNSIYLHALALYKVDKKQESRQLLFLLADKHDTWGSIDEVHYLMAIIDFEWKSTVDALEHLAKIKDEKIKQDAYNLKKAQLGENTVERLKYLYAKYPNDEALGKVLLTKLYEINGGSDMVLLEELQDKYNTNEPVKVDTPTIDKRDSYNVAILLPFNAQNLNGGSKSNFVIELYEGILIGLKDLEAKGVKLNVYTYDTKRDSAATAKILANPDMLNMDLCIGPLYGNTLPLIQRFSKEHKIPFVNPISDNSRLIQDNPYGFLLSSGYETVAKRVADFSVDNLKGKKAVIIHGASAKDTLTAKAFTSEFIANGGEVHTVFKYPDEYAYRSMINELSDIKQDTGKYFVYIASTNVALGRTSLSALRNLLFEGVILAPSRWVDISQMSYTRLEEANVHFVNPGYYDEESTVVKKFRSDYVQKVKVLPTTFAFMGYEAISFFGNALHTYGPNFMEAIHSDGNSVSGTLYHMLGYQGGNDNQQVEILKFEDGKLRLVEMADR